MTAVLPCVLRGATLEVIRACCGNAACARPRREQTEPEWEHIIRFDVQVDDEVEAASRLKSDSNPASDLLSSQALRHMELGR